MFEIANGHRHRFAFGLTVQAGEHQAWLHALAAGDLNQLVNPISASINGKEKVSHVKGEGRRNWWGFFFEIIPTLKNEAIENRYSVVLSNVHIGVNATPLQTEMRVFQYVGNSHTADYQHQSSMRKTSIQQTAYFQACSIHSPSALPRRFVQTSRRYNPFRYTQPG